MTVKFNREAFAKGPDVLCFGDIALKKDAWAKFQVIDGNMADKRVDFRFTLHTGEHVQWGFGSAAQMNEVVEVWGLHYTPNEQGFQGIDRGAAGPPKRG